MRPCTCRRTAKEDAAFNAAAKDSKNAFLQQRYHDVINEKKALMVQLMELTSKASGSGREAILALALGVLIGLSSCPEAMCVLFSSLAASCFRSFLWRSHSS